MALEGEYEPSPWEPVAEQVRLYEETGGEEGRTLEGQPCVILTTRGRKTGKIRKTPLMRVEHDGTYAVVASMGGAPQHPVWYLNLVADPDVTVQDGAEVMDLRAREVSGDEKAEGGPGPPTCGRTTTPIRRRPSGRSPSSSSSRADRSICPAPSGGRMWK